MVLNSSLDVNKNLKNLQNLGKTQYSIDSATMLNMYMILKVDANLEEHQSNFLTDASVWNTKTNMCLHRSFWILRLFFSSNCLLLDVLFCEF